MNPKRIITALIVVPLLYLFIRYAPEIYFFGLILIITLLGLYEFYTMCAIPVQFSVPGLLAGGTFFSAAFYYPQGLLNTMFFGLAFLMILRLFLVKNRQDSIKTISRLSLGIYYVAGFAVFIPMIMRDFGVYFTIFLFASVWLADSMAYFIGKNFGRRKLYFEISPNKTVEGAAGSILGGCLGAVIIYLSHPIMNTNLTAVLFIGIIIGIVTIIGDLIESMFKRDAGIKDSGSLIPGHGGFLDKMDSFLLSGPTLYLLLKYFKLYG